MQTWGTAHAKVLRWELYGEPEERQGEPCGCRRRPGGAGEGWSATPRSGGIMPDTVSLTSAPDVSTSTALTTILQQ